MKSINKIYDTLNKLYYYNYGHKKDAVDCLFISFPKSGRTWIRYILANYFFLNFNIDVNLNLNTQNNKNLPKIKFSHDLNMIKLHKKSSIIILLRDPRDIIVSYYHHVSKRNNSYKGNIDSFVMSNKYGFKCLLKYFNKLQDILCTKKDYIIIYYEDIINNDINEVTKILDYLNINIDNNNVKLSCGKSKFNKMRKIESNNTLNDSRLSVINNGRKCRKGKIGAYREELSNVSINYINEIINKSYNKLLYKYKGSNKDKLNNLNN